MLEELKKIVFEENLELVKRELVIYTWGNVSGLDIESKTFAIKPSGVDYDVMKAEDMVVLDLEGNKLEGKYKPSSDTATHIELYKAFPEIGGIVHTHSSYATSWAQARKDIPALGTTHADYFYGDIPCARPLTKEEIEGEYEKNTGLVIIETLKKRNINPMDIPGIIIASHGPFAWGKDAKEAVHNAVVMEELAKMAYRTIQITPEIKSVEQYLLNKHYFRKHGANAYYGQN
ncbi:L-ribulose-5-phosphate 4-epimerase [Brachyspira murdochii]|uniref:Ribulose 5-phosphate epimerase n=1 Tax=Brachyspira murdochii TaxID=84378 RepID=A0ABX5B547_9SPIR|nr:L-ribulose-5-phosphate 4-epimerase [Brachyspira murdochii]PPS22405.1 ribulose 5-phosphate epimerase [Brachyspira murdochii]